MPPRAGAGPKQIEAALKQIEGWIGKFPFDAINVPEILGSGFQGMDALDFGLLVRERFDVPVVANKVTVHSPPDKLRAWFQRAIREGLSSVILVGGERSHIYYPGPGVLQSNRLLREVAEKEGHPDFPLGNITIPSRPREAGRMLEKSRQGADYFTTQIIYESSKANAHLQAYDDVCSLSREPPRPVLYAFSPVGSAQDVQFLRYLGVHIPPEVEQALVARPDGAAAASLEVIEHVWERLLDMAAERAVRVPLGLIIEPVSLHNDTIVADMVARLTRAWTAQRAHA